MYRDAEGGFSVTVDLDAGRAYRFRYLLDGQRWDNDWAADAYEPNDFGGDDSVVDLTALAEAVRRPRGGTGEEGGASAGRQEGSASGEASREAAQIASARAGRRRCRDRASRAHLSRGRIVPRR